MARCDRYAPDRNGWCRTCRRGPEAHPRPPIPAHHAEAAQQEAEASDYSTMGSML